MNLFRPYQNQTFAFIVILLAGLSLRLAIISIPFNTDERKNIVIAQDIGWDHLPAEDKYVTHALLNLYLTRIDMALFGNSKIGIRIIHLILGILTLILVYDLLRGLGRTEALLALFLFGFNQYHIHSSVRAENESLLLFLLTLSLWLFYKAVVEKKTGMFYVLGVIAGLAFLTKGVTLLLILGFAIYLISTAEGRSWFRRKEFYVSLLLFFVTISPWMLWVSRHGTSQLIFNKTMYQAGQLVPKLTALNFYLVELVSRLKNTDYRLLISWEYGILDGTSGAFYLLSIAAGAFLIRNPLHRLLMTVFLTFTLVLSFFAAPGLPWGEFWWASPSLIPAVCLTAMTGAHLARRQWLGKIVLSLFIMYTTVNAIYFIATARTRLAQPPHRLATFVDNDYIVAQIQTDRGRINSAFEEMERLLQQSPNNVEVMDYYGWLAWHTQNFDTAVKMWLESAELEPDYDGWSNWLDEERRIIMTHYETRAKRNPDDASAHRIVGRLFHHFKKYQKAEKELTRSLELNPQSPSGLYSLGLTHFDEQNYQEAINDFQAVLVLHPDDHLSNYYLGRAYQELGLQEEAARYFQTAVTLNPDDAKSYYELSQILKDRPQYADRMFQKARSVYHQDVRLRVFRHMHGRYRALFKP